MTNLRDLAERTASTYVVAFLGIVLASGAFDATGTVHLSIVQQALVAAIPAALAIPINLVRIYLAEPPKTKAGDILLRTVFTWVETFGGLLLASNVFNIGATGQMKAVAAMGVASIPAALSFLKANVATLFGNKDSGSLDPTVGPTLATH